MLSSIGDEFSQLDLSNCLVDCGGPGRSFAKPERADDAARQRRRRQHRRRPQDLENAAGVEKIRRRSRQAVRLLRRPRQGPDPSACKVRKA